MSGITLDQLEFDPTAPTEPHAVGAYIISSSGTVIDDTAGALDVNIANASLVVTATDLDIRDLAFATDSVDVSGSSVTVSGTDIDIRDLVNTQDSIAIGDETNLVDLEQNDAAFGGGYGFSLYGVRQDAGGSPVSADGDAHPLVFNNDGELKVAADLTSSVADDDADSGNPIKVGGRGVTTASALGALSATGDRFDLLGDLYRRVFTNDSHNVGWQTSTATIATTALELAATPLAGRKSVIIQNQGSQPIYVGEANTVTTANGIRIPKGASMTFEFGEALDVWAIAPSGSQDIRVIEAA